MESTVGIIIQQHWSQLPVDRPERELPNVNRPTDDTSPVYFVHPIESCRAVDTLPIEHPSWIDEIKLAAWCAEPATPSGGRGFSEDVGMHWRSVMWHIASLLGKIPEVEDGWKPVASVQRTWEKTLSLADIVVFHQHQTSFECKPVLAVEFRDEDTFATCAAQIEEICAQPHFDWPQGIHELSGNGQEGKRLLMQINATMAGHMVPAAAVVGSNTIYLIQRVMTGPKAELLVVGPLYQCPQDGQPEITFERFIRFVACAYIRVLDQRPTPNALVRLNQYWSEKRASICGASVWSVRTALAQVARYQLALCEHVRVQLGGGIALNMANRRCNDINVPIDHGWFAGLVRCVLRYLGATPCLQVDDVAGEGKHSVCLRGVYLGVPFVIKWQKEGTSGVVQEWAHFLQEGTSGVGQGAPSPSDHAVARYFPSYYGLFASDSNIFSMMSDNGVDLDEQWGVEIPRSIFNEVSDGLDGWCNSFVYDGHQLVGVGFTIDD
ncbi:hypothetical protein C8Q78DRAFT_61596 [Trametes maxima]|nr:hypothetical protein C8Q78DRAFT_61596 [Trametes maxima]